MVPPGRWHLMVLVAVALAGLAATAAGHWTGLLLALLVLVCPVVVLVAFMTLPAGQAATTERTNVRANGEKEW